MMCIYIYIYTYIYIYIEREIYAPKGVVEGVSADELI